MGEPWMPSLCSSDSVFTPLRSPSEPSSFTRNFGTMKQEMPLVPAGAPGVRASTRCTIWSVMSWSP